MQVKIMKEAGYVEAIRGMSYSYHDRAVDVDEWWHEQYPKAQRRATALAGNGAGHDKFLRQIQLWIDIEASRAWWQEFSTYKVGVVENSESTMHKLAKRQPTIDDFEDGAHLVVVNAFCAIWRAHKDDINIIKMCLPEGYLQRRMVTLNYANLRNIIEQRAGHRLKWWQVFIDAVLAQVEHPELLA